MGELIFLLLVIKGTLLIGPIFLLGIIALFICVAYCEFWERWERLFPKAAGREVCARPPTT